MQRALLILLVAVSYLLFAGAPPWTLWPLLIIAVAGLLLSPARLSEPRDRPFELALAGVVAAIALQLLPLPSALVAVVSPQADAVKAAIRFGALGARPPAFTPLSIDAGATLVSLATVVLGAVSFSLARAVFSAGGGTRVFCRALAFLGALAAVVAVVQKAVAPRMVLFMMAPDARSANPFGAFVNRNHFAAWLLLVVAPVCGYLIARQRIHTGRGRGRESVAQVLSSGIIFTGIAVMVMIGVLLLTLSRSAVAGLGAAAVAGWLLGRPRLQIERTSLPMALGVIGGVLLLAVLFVDIDGWATRMAQSFSNAPAGLSRLRIWQESLPIARDFWAVGTGAGTFSDAMVQYQQSRVWVGSMQRWAHFNNAHSHYLQVACEGGLLLGLPVLAAILTLATLGMRAVRADKGEMFWVRAGAAAGLIGLAAQSIWEVALTMPANAVMAGALAGLLLHRRDGSRSELTPPDLLTPRGGQA